MKLTQFNREKRMSVGRMILLSGIVAATSSVASGAINAGPLERSSDSYSDEAEAAMVNTTRNTNSESKNMTGFKKRKPIPVCDKLNAGLECSTDAGKTRALKFPEPVDEKITK